MKKKLLLLTCFFVSPIFCFIDKTVFSGAISFPKNLNATPHIRVYSGGNKLPCAVKDNVVSFEFEENKYRSHFYILITPTFSLRMIADNVVDYACLNPNQPYKFFEVTLLKAERRWQIRELMLSKETGKIPDEAIIVCYDPEYIHKIDGGEILKLPTIYIKDNVLDLAGSEEKLHEQSIQYVLASLRLDPFHATAEQTIKNRTRQNSTCKM